jgi:uncharacterized membrane protein YedE/YeeE
MSARDFPDWIRAGLWLAAAFFLAMMLVKPIGVSTQFVIVDGIAWDALDNGLVTRTETGYTSSNAYLAKSGGKYAGAVADPLSYGLLFVLAMPLGAFLSTRLMAPPQRNPRNTDPCQPATCRRAGFSRAQRLLMAFGGGFLVLFGARLAGGCTSGHMMSGMSQSSVSGYLFAAGVFATGVPLAMALYRRPISHGGVS